MTDDDKIKIPFASFRFETGREYVENRETVDQERLISYEMARILRDRVRECYRREGVNHMKRCSQHYAAYVRHVRPDLVPGAPINDLNDIVKPQYPADKFPRDKYDI